MVDQIKIVGFAGSLRRASFNRGLIRAAAASAPPGITLDVYDLVEIPLYNQDVEDAGEPASVVAFKRAIENADALLVATPEYNHGMPGVLKNAFDWASRPRARPTARRSFCCSPRRGSGSSASASSSMTRAAPGPRRRPSGRGRSRSGSIDPISSF